jgi:DNA-binding response OmpR family regulator
MKHILIVEDEAAISDLIALNLNLAGYAFTQVFDGISAAAALDADTATFDLAILDIMLPGMDGYGVLERARHYDIPAIILSAKSTLIDRVTGLNEGADDYLTKPFEAVELLARIEAVLRRRGAMDALTHIGDIVVDLQSRAVCRGDATIDLTLKEYELLAFFLSHRNKALTRARILEAVWGYDFLGESRTVDIHVQRLRKKLGERVHITTVYKYGYRLETLP